MMTKTTRSIGHALAVVALVFSGCVNAPDAADPSTPEPSERPDTLAWGLTDCRYVVSWTYVDGDALAPYLPSGFTVRPSGAAVPPRLGGDTLFGVDAMTCDAGRGLNATQTPMEFGYVWAAADPPDALLQNGIDPAEHYVKWDVLIPDEDRRRFLGDRGVAAHDGSASFDETLVGFQARLRLEGLGVLGIETVVHQDLGAFDGDFVKFSETSTGVLGWRAHATSGPRTSGQALMTLPEGSWMAEVAGDTTLRGGFHAGTWSYDPAVLLFLGVQ